MPQHSTLSILKSTVEYSPFCVETRKETSSKCQLVLEMDGYINGQTLQHSNALILYTMRRTCIKEMEIFYAGT
jgi:hypothetical protein